MYGDSAGNCGDGALSNTTLEDFYDGILGNAIQQEPVDRDHGAQGQGQGQGQLGPGPGGPGEDERAKNLPYDSDDILGSYMTYLVACSSHYVPPPKSNTAPAGSTVGFLSKGNASSASSSSASSSAASANASATSRAAAGSAEGATPTGSSSTPPPPPPPPSESMDQEALAKKALLKSKSKGKGKAGGKSKAGKEKGSPRTERRDMVRNASERALYT